MEAIYTAIATSTGGRDGHIKSSDGILDMEVRKPVKMGGKGGATNPEQLFAAGYSACFNSALYHVAIAQRIRIISTVTAKVSIGKSDKGEGYQLAVEMEVIIPGIEQEKAEEFARMAHQFCPYSNAIRNNVEVKLTVKV